MSRAILSHDQASMALGTLAGGDPLCCDEEGIVTRETISAIGPSRRHHRVASMLSGEAYERAGCGLILKDDGEVAIRARKRWFESMFAWIDDATED